jgi:hypothetical protein
MTLGNDGSATFNGRMNLLGGSDGNLSGITTGYNDLGLTIGRNQAGAGNVNFITGSYGAAFYATNGSGVIAAPYLTAGGAGITTPGIVTCGAGQATWNSGTGAPSATRPIGSLYSRTDGAVGTTLYVSRGAGTWAAVAGV